MSVEQFLQRRWYHKPGWLWLLLPLEWLFRGIIALRYCFYRCGLFSSWRAPVPVIVIGNISVGGTGKTPVTIALCEALQQAGFHPGVISRGYRAQPPNFPHLVTIDGSAAECGDEPLLIARRTGCPVMIAPQRVAAARALLQLQHCDVLICDDGLQHYALQRDIECVVIDAARGFGNGHCLPLGPLREPVRRLRRADALLVNGGADESAADKRYGFALAPTAMVNLRNGETLEPRAWWQRYPRAHAVAGIGNPARFFATLRALGGAPIEHAFADHHAFSAADLQFDATLPVVMTEKDAVKCAAFASDRHWYLRVSATLPDSLISALIGKLRAVKV
jgi:tetraacyldisaccharide 4'-kinase